MTPTPSVPALYAARTVHVRQERISRRFRYGMYLWLVDVDDLPRLPGPFAALARFRAGDHVGDPKLGIRENIAALLAEHGVALDAGDRVLMLASAAVFGHVFNPISLFWCFGSGGELRYVVAEVHNTYGGRHAYVLRPDEHDRAETPKRLYVSPFFAVDGEYALRVPVPGERLAVSVRLFRDERRPAFTASLTGVRRPGGLGPLLRLLARYPLPTLRVSALIRWQGIRIWLRGLPVVPRPGSRPDRPARQEEHDHLLATRNSWGWIHKYVFPGGLIPSIPAIREHARREAGLEIRQRRAFGQHYAETLRLWRERFDAARADVLALGFDDVFCRMWDFYLAYSQAGFSSGHIDVEQIVLGRDSVP